MSCKFIWFSLPIKIKKAVRTYNSQLSSEVKKIEWYNLPKKINLLYDELYLIKGAQGSLPKPSNFIWYNLPNKLQSLCNLLDFELDGNFDITANWDVGGVTDIDSFKQFIIDSSGLSEEDIVVSTFERIGDRVVANVDITGSNFTFTSFINISEVKRLGNLIGNNISFVFSSNTTEDNLDFILDREYSAITSLTITGEGNLVFQPSTNISNNLTTLSIFGVTSVDFNPQVALPESLISLEIIDTGLEDFNPSLYLPSQLSEISLLGNLLTSLNSSFILPESVTQVAFNNNQFTTQGYEDSEDWATAQPYFINGCNMSFTGNPDSPIGTNFETILATKNVTLSY
jgi:hypothetical protein